MYNKISYTNFFASIKSPAPTLLYPHLWPICFCNQNSMYAHILGILLWQNYLPLHHDFGATTSCEPCSVLELIPNFPCCMA